MHALVPSLMKWEAFPELVRKQPLITETLKLEETRFKETVGRGMKILNDEVAGKRQAALSQARKHFVFMIPWLPS